MNFRILSKLTICVTHGLIIPDVGLDWAYRMPACPYWEFFFFFNLM